MLPVAVMFHNLARAVKIAARDDGFVQTFIAAAFLIVIGTLVYWLSEDWSLVNSLYFAVATLTTSSIADPQLVLTSASMKIFTIFYLLVGLGILVELVRQLGMAFITLRREEQEKRHARQQKHAASTSSD